MNVRSGFIDSIGNTPLIKLIAASEATGCNIYGKAEFLNPGGSVKDRAALAIIEDAEKRGTLRPGGVIVEGTAGNTGIGLALVANARGYRSVIVMPETQSQEKKDMLRLCGADLRLVPALPYANPGNYVRYSGTLAEELAPRPSRTARSGPTSSTTSPTATATTARPAPRSGSRPTARSTASPARSAPAARWAAWRCALKERNPDVKIALADPMGSALYNCYAKGELKAEGNSITEGIGQGRVTANLEGTPIDMAYQITDEEALPVLFDLIQHEGLVLGGSTAINIVGAMRLASDLGPGKTIVTILADGGQRYQSKLFNPGLPAREEPAAAVLDEVGGDVGAARARPRRSTPPIRCAASAICFQLPAGVIYLDGNSLGPAAEGGLRRARAGRAAGMGRRPDPQLERGRLVRRSPTRWATASAA